MRHSCLVLVPFIAAGLAAAAEPPRYQFGDDPRWADPNFDDSSWSVAQSGSRVASNGGRMGLYDDNLWSLNRDASWPAHAGIMWVRFRISLPAAVDKDLALMDAGCPDSLGLPHEWRLNGRLIGNDGSFPPRATVTVRPGNCVFPIPTGEAAPDLAGIVALRVWYPPFRSGVDEAYLVFASRNTLEQRARLAVAEARYARVPDTAVSLFFVLFGPTLLFFWKVGRGSATLFWLGWWALIDGMFNFVGIIPWNLDPHWSYDRFWAVYAAFNFLNLATGLEFPWTAFEIRRRWPLRALQGMALLRALGAYYIITADVAGLAFSYVSNAMRVLNLVPFAVLAGVSAWQLRRKSQSGPIAIAMILLATLVLAVAGYFKPWLSIPPFLTVGPFLIDPRVPGGFLPMLAVSVVLLRRLWKTWQRRSELEAEFDAARQMQQALVPPAASSRGFAVASAYLPAREVGGDFYWLLPGADGSLLLVVGDVSGKGLKAAMSVATLAGAVRDWPGRGPARVLAHLNAVLYGRAGDGFTTCCVALFEADGRVSIANAGHLPPYRNGAEMEVEAGLPLGLTPEPEYAEVEFTVLPGDGITFVSDGVVEARSATGELYGFERTCAVSTQSASEIAETAKAFGQEDDITVITIRREKAAVTFR